MLQPGQIEFIVEQYSNFENNSLSDEPISLLDCIARIVYQLTMMDQHYTVDYNILESYVNADGKRILLLDFRSPGQAMIIKLSGICKELPGDK